MKLYLLDDPARPAEYARFSHVGTWAEDRICHACGEPLSKLVEPLQIEWNEGTDVIGDFSWGGYHCVVVDRVRAFLESERFEVHFGRVEVLPPTEQATHPQVPHPYRGPHLSWLIPTARLPVDEHESGVSLLSDCSSCSQKRYTFKRDGLVVRRSAWAGEKLFLVEQFGRSRATFVTADGLKLLQGAGFANLCPRPAGVIAT